MSCGLLSGPGVGPIVETQVDKLMQYGDRFTDEALTAIQAIKDGFVTQTYASVGASSGGSGVAGVATAVSMVNPTPPSAISPALELPEVATAPDLDGLDQASIEASAPTYDVAKPSITLPSRPDLITPTPPDDPPAISTPSYPTAPTLNYPSPPVLSSIQLPTLTNPDLASIIYGLQVLRSAKPTAPAEPTDWASGLADQVAQQLQMSKTGLSSYIGQCPALASVCPRLAELLSGNSVGYPAPVAEALRNRAFSTIERETIALERQVSDEWLSRGFSLPGGPLFARIDAARQVSIDKKADHNLAVFIEEAKQEIDNLRFAIQQGITYEAQLAEQYIKLYDLAREIGNQWLTGHIQFYGLLLDRYQKLLSGWQAEQEFFKTWLQAELSRLEEYKAKLDAAKLLGTLRQQDIDLYLSQLKGLEVEVTLYRSRIDAANAQLQGQSLVLEGYKTATQIYAEKIQANNAEWQGYDIATRGELGKAQIAETMAKLFDTRVRLYQTEAAVDKDKAGLVLEKLRLRLDRWEKNMERAKILLQETTAEADTAIKVHESNTRLYSAQVGAESAVAEAQAKGISLNLEQQRILTNVELEEAKIALERTLETSKIAMGALQEIARITATVGSGAMSALHMSASMGVSTDFSNRSSCDESYSY